MDIFTIQLIMKVKVEYPLKQGLKPPIAKTTNNTDPQAVKVEYPLKQGLKLFVTP